MKNWYLSKTLWLNAIAAIALLIQTRYGFIIDAEIQAALLTLINAGLRIITKEPLNWQIPSAADELPPSPPAAGFINLRCLVELFLIGLTVAVLAACATTNPATPTTRDTPIQVAGKSLLAVKGTIVSAAQATDGLCRAQQLSVDTCSQAKATYEQSKLAYDSTVEAYLMLSANGGDPAAFGAALVRLQAIAQNLVLIAGGDK